MRVIFGSLKVDQPDLLNGELEEALNCIPYVQSYAPFPEAVPYSAAAPANVRGAYSTKDTSGNVNTFIGTAANLYRESATALNVVTRTATYNTPIDSVWEFVTFGDTCLAMNGTDPMQTYTLGTSSQFLDMSASASAPIAAHVASVRDFVMVGNTSTGGNRVQWCQINNANRWGFSPQRQSDFQDLPGIGSSVVRITGGDFAAIFTEQSIWRASYVGSPLIFRFDEVSPNIGCAASGSCARFQGQTFFLSDSGFYSFDGNSAVPIGNEQVDGTFLDDLNESFAYKITSCIDPVNKLYIVSYPSVASGDGTCDKMIIFGWAANRWTFVSHSLEYLFVNFTSGVTLDSMDAFGSMETLPYSLDSRAWMAGLAVLAGIDINHKITRFTGAAKTARFITGEAQLVQDRRAFIRAIRPLVQGTSDTVISSQIGWRNRLIDPTQWSNASTMNALGGCPTRVDARFQRLRIDVSGGFDRVMGADIDLREAGVR